MRVFSIIKIFIITCFIFVFLLSLRDYIKLKNIRSELSIANKVIDGHAKTLYPQLIPFMELRDMFYSRKVRNLKRFQNGEVKYDQIYEYDQVGLRNVNINSREVARKHLILAGCSIVFGEGLSEEENLISQFRKKIRSKVVYNFGISGAGPHDHVEFLELLPFDEYVIQEEGSYIYLYFEDHLRRATLHPSYLIWAGGERSYYDFDGVNKLPSKISKIKESFPWKKFQFATNIKLVHTYLDIKHTPQEDFSDRDITLTAGIVAQIKKQYLSKFPKGKFYFAYFPIFPPHPLHKQKMNKALEKFEIDILNFPQFEETFSKMTLKERERMIIPEDGHPSFEASQLLANELSELLNNL